MGPNRYCLATSIASHLRRGRPRSVIMKDMRRNIVEGEPGIFPYPVGRFIRWIGRGIRRLFGKR